MASSSTQSHIVIRVLPLAVVVSLLYENVVSDFYPHCYCSLRLLWYLGISMSKMHALYLFASGRLLPPLCKTIFKIVP